jgi:hypothetical protein
MLVADSVQMILIILFLNIINNAILSISCVGCNFLGGLHQQGKLSFFDGLSTDSIIILLFLGFKPAARINLFPVSVLHFFYDCNRQGYDPNPDSFLFP